ncbi:hypothetical protein RF55_3708 [Lasius niger]|uniref:Uncharacterized protein n=1 Tax=Lasius niger TaxID=67767 RepID=A0A0J7NUF3_LASNI|nr:hypothetical protein RF55_3708 [Lasius niger]
MSTKDAERSRMATKDAEQSAPSDGGDFTWWGCKIVRWNEIVTLLHTFLLLLAIVANIYGRILNIIEKQR